ncbi:hypothetical protein MPNT_50056 [Candidatus Methylacidithermus pantelleriae]|uniref:Uncharacterized protein n=1 Tax=Candidatus Methylacidithermus pantelleriae TaxID=2744239 RepID=A0A8J2BMK1_9BACT|nr:hypothetical protein MPNT_50056 [Candidatus Methylacidithermus pantelleriae]
MCRTRRILLPFAGDLPELPSSALAAVGQKTTTPQGQESSRACRPPFPPPKVLPVLMAAKFFRPTSAPKTVPDARACLSSLSTRS